MAELDPFFAATADSPEPVAAGGAFGRAKSEAAVHRDELLESRLHNYRVDLAEWFTSLCLLLPTDPSHPRSALWLIVHRGDPHRAAS